MGESLLDLVYPRECLVCGRQVGPGSWYPRGPGVPGLRPWDSPPLCRGCGYTLAMGVPVTRELHLDDGEPVVVHAAKPTHGQLVDLVGAWKYKGLRGLAWPLGDMFCAAWTVTQLHAWCPGGLVPLPLHAGRRRSRGFNQAEILAEALARHAGLPLRRDLLVRIRATGQQAKVVGSANRLANVAGGFRGSRGSVSEPPGPVGLVDDLVTSGATAWSAVSALRGCGLRVGCVLALGLAPGRN